MLITDILKIFHEVVYVIQSQFLLDPVYTCIELCQSPAIALNTCCGYGRIWNINSLISLSLFDL